MTRALRLFTEHWPIWAGLVFCALGFAYVHRDKTHIPSLVVTFSVGDVQAVHPSVTVGRVPVSGVVRVAAGDAIETGPDGRARVRLDDGTSFVLDKDSRLVVDGAGSRFERGRAFVRAPDGAPSRVSFLGATLSLGGASVALDVGAKRAYCAAGEATVQKGGENHLRAGESAVLEAAVSIEPEKAFLDWTSGMAVPWGVAGRPRAAIGELWGRPVAAPADDVGAPLAVRAHVVDAKVDGEVAVTRVSTTYFNASDGPVRGDYRMTLPESAIVARFAEESGGSVHEGRVAAAKGGASGAPKLEWAGEGLVRATTSALDPGQTLTLIVEYVEWLTKHGDTVSYRYPMLGEGTPPLLGEFRARIDATAAGLTALRVPAGASVSGGVVELSKADHRPTSDLVVEVSRRPHALGAARAYVAAAAADDPGGDYVLVRTETRDAQPTKGATLAVVVDTSLSVSPAQLDASRGVVEAIVQGLGPTDHLVVLAADQDTHPVGPATLGPVDDARRRDIVAGLTALTPGGATDLGAALERAADLLPSDSPEGMVLYVGDGWPTVGELGMDQVRSRLARRRRGIPRLGAVAVGPVANRFGLAGLVRGAGPVLDLSDRAQAHEVATLLFAEALRPAVAGVDVDLGPGVERVYPRGARTVVAGSSLLTVGRLRGPLPGTIGLQAAGARAERRLLVRHDSPRPEDLRRRWAAARIEELALRGEGQESTVDAALRTGLLSPWTAWVLGDDRSYAPSPLEARMLDLSPLRAAPLTARLATPPLPLGALFLPDEPRRSGVGDADLERAIVAAATRTLDGAMDAVRACRDSRAALRLDLSGALRVSLRLAGDGTAKKITVRATLARDDDPALDRCVEAVVASLGFFAAGTTTDVVVTHELRLPPPRGAEGRRCSRASTLPLGARRGVWYDRVKREPSASTYLSAKLSCELPAWADRRALLELFLDLVPGGAGRVALARALEDVGEPEAAEVVRREALRRAKSPDELHEVRVALLGDERAAVAAFSKRYAEAHGDEARLSVVRRFLRLAPHDGTLLRRLFALLEATGQRDALVAEVARVRQDPYADAAVLAEGAAVLLRLGDVAEARRAFGELVERAPNDPAVHAFLGDRLLDAGLHDAATATYATLAALSPGDPATALRRALSHLGAGRLDLASRALAELRESGGPTADPKLSLLAGVLDGASLAATADRAGGDDAALLARRRRTLALPPDRTYVLVRRLSGEREIEATLVRGVKDDVESPPDAAAPALGLFVHALERGDRSAKLVVRAPVTPPPARPARVRVDVLRADAPLVSREVELPLSGKALSLRWTGAALE